MQEAVKQRIKDVLLQNNETINSFSKKINAVQSTINSQINGKATLSVNTLCEFHYLFPHISSEWLLTGRGEMLNSGEVIKNEKTMNTDRLEELILSSKLSKLEIASRCNISRTTLDNAIQGSDVKISTVESLARVFNVSVGYLFGDDLPDEHKSEEWYLEEIKRLQTLLDNKECSKAKVLIELEVDNDEFVKMGLKDKVIQVLNK